MLIVLCYLSISNYPSLHTPLLLSYLLRALSNTNKLTKYAYLIDLHTQHLRDSGDFLLSPFIPIFFILPASFPLSCVIPIILSCTHFPSPSSSSSSANIVFFNEDDGSHRVRFFFAVTQVHRFTYVCTQRLCIFGSTID